MFNRHPNEAWKNEFQQRNLIAFSSAPLLLYPTHYTGDDGYISDTEDSQITPIVLIDNKGKTNNVNNEIYSQNFNAPSTLNAPNLNIQQQEYHYVTNSLGKRDPGEL